jgi:hypothetical protein
VRDGRQSKAARVHQAALRACQLRSADGGVDGRGAERPGELSEPVGELPIDVDVLGELVLGGRDVILSGRDPDPERVELCDLLPEGHLLHQRPDALGGGPADFTPG